MSRACDVYGIGHALVDVQYSVSPEFLRHHGIAKGVMTLIDEQRQAVLARALQQPPIASASGGSAANTLIGVASFGGQAYCACQLGDDEWGAFYGRDLEKAGVRTSSHNRVPGRTGQCLVFITPDADRTLNTFLGVSGSLGPDRIEAGVLADSQYVYLEGYLLSSDQGFAACCRAQELARRGEVRVALTLSDPFMVVRFRQQFTELVDGGVDLLFCNEDEAWAYAAGAGDEAAFAALGHLAPQVCITCGSRGAVLYQQGARMEVPGIRVQAVDTTGAGDLFAGGVLFGLTHGYALRDAAKLGSYAAAQVVTRYGPRLEQALGDQINAILAYFA